MKNLAIILIGIFVAIGLYSVINIGIEKINNSKYEDFHFIEKTEEGFIFENKNNETVFIDMETAKSYNLVTEIKIKFDKEYNFEIVDIKKNIK